MHKTLKHGTLFITNVDSLSWLLPCVVVWMNNFTRRHFLSEFHEQKECFHLISVVHRLSFTYYEVLLRSYSTVFNWDAKWCLIRVIWRRHRGRFAAQYLIKMPFVSSLIWENQEVSDTNDCILLWNAIALGSSPAQTFVYYVLEMVNQVGKLVFLPFHLQLYYMYS